MTPTGTLALLLAATLAGDPIEDLRSTDARERARGQAALEADAEGSLLLRALRAPDGPVREAGAAAAAAHPERSSPGVRLALRAILRDRDAGGAPRAAAARALAAAKDAGAVPDLRAALPDLPRDASLALADLADASALPELRSLRDRDPAAAIPELGYALAVLGDPAGEEILLARLAGADPGAASAALHLLRRLTGKDLGPSVALWTEVFRLRRLAAALGDRDVDAAEKAMEAALASGPGAAADLLSVLSDRSAPREARGKAALALGILGSQDAGPALLEASRIGEDPWVRVYALEALGRVAWAPAAPVIARMLVNDEDTEVPKSFADSGLPFDMVQTAGARALVDMGCEGALGVFVEQLSRGGLSLLPTACVNEFRIRVLYAAMDSLRTFGGPGAADGFGFQPEAGEREKAAAADRAVRWWRSRPADLAVKARARFDDPLFAARVHREIEILGQYKFLEMDRSRRALILLGSPAVPHLSAAVAADPAADPNGQTRIGAAQVLAGIGHPSGIPPVRAALARAELLPVRCQLLVALAVLGPPGGVPEAIPLLDGSSDDERAAAADALSRCPTPRSGPALRRAFARRDLDATRRLLLGAALLGIRDGAGAEPLLAALADRDRVLRRRAWEGLDRFVEGLGPFDPETGEGAADVRARFEARKANPRFRPGTLDGGGEAR